MQFSKGNEPKWSVKRNLVESLVWCLLEGVEGEVVEGVNLNATNDESNGLLNDDGEQHSNCLKGMEDRSLDSPWPP